MGRSIFGWDYPPGCSGTPYDEPQAIDLRDGRTLKGYGRSQHGIHGKDADLDYGGQNYIKEAFWLDDGTITISGHRYASVCGSDDWDDDTWSLATELVANSDIPGEWDGDYWVLGEDYHLKLNFDWNDSLSDEDNVKAATAAAYDAIRKDSESFELATAELAKKLDSL